MDCDCNKVTRDSVTQDMTAYACHIPGFNPDGTPHPFTVMKDLNTVGNRLQEEVSMCLSYVADIV